MKGFPCLVLLFVAISPATFAGEAREIPVIRTWGELVSAEPLFGGVPADFNTKGELPDSAGTERATVRVGIDRAACRPGQGAVLYCLVESEEQLPAGRTSSSGDLGPLRVEIEHPTRQPQTVEIAQSMASAAKSRRWLWMKVIPMPETGTYRVRLRERRKAGGGQIVADAEVRVTGERSQPWYPWGAAPDGVDPAPPSGDDGLEISVVTNPVGGPALPAGGAFPQSVPDNVDAGAALPQLLPSHPEAAISVQAGKNALTLEVGNKCDLYNGDLIFLTRWWIDGKPLTLTGRFEPESRARSEARQVALVNRIQFRIHFDAKRFGVVEGDEIGLQALFCPPGWIYAEAPEVEMPAGVMDEPSGRLPELAHLAPRVDYVYRGGDLVPAK